jgi:hypothetical protein
MQKVSLLFASLFGLSLMLGAHSANATGKEPVSVTGHGTLLSQSSNPPSNIGDTGSGTGTSGSGTRGTSGTTSTSGRVNNTSNKSGNGKRNRSTGIGSTGSGTGTSGNGTRGTSGTTSTNGSNVNNRNVNVGPSPSLRTSPAPSP